MYICIVPVLTSIMIAWSSFFCPALGHGLVHTGGMLQNGLEGRLKRIPAVVVCSYIIRARMSIQYGMLCGVTIVIKMRYFSVLCARYASVLGVAQSKVLLTAKTNKLVIVNLWSYHICICDLRPYLFSTAIYTLYLIHTVQA